MTIAYVRFVLFGMLLLSACAAALAPQWAHAAAADLFAQAAARGDLRVAVTYVTPPAVPGAKVRTADRLDAPAIAALAKILNLPVKLMQLAPAEAAAALAEGSIDLALYSLPATAPEPPGVTRVPTSYRTYPKAVIRTDTDIDSRADLKGRTVCLAGTAEHAALEATAAGAVLLPFAVPSDALVAVREGRCDLGLIDQTVWQPLMDYPEWKKFSATIELSDHPRTLTWLVSSEHTQEADWLRARMQQWDSAGQWASFSKQWATDVAFDVYLDQEVPDCHG